MLRELVERAAKGDQEAFASLVQVSSGRLYAVAYRILRDPYLAEDALQQTLITIWSELPRLRDPDRFEAWTYRVIVRASTAEAKRSKRAATSLRLLPDDADRAAGPDEFGAVAERDRPDRAFKRLTADQRAVLVMQHYLGLTPVDMAEVLEIPVGTVGSRLRVYAARRSVRRSKPTNARRARRNDRHDRLERSRSDARLVPRGRPAARAGPRDGCGIGVRGRPSAPPRPVAVPQARRHGTAHVDVQPAVRVGSGRDRADPRSGGGDRRGQPALAGARCPPSVTASPSPSISPIASPTVVDIELVDPNNEITWPVTITDAYRTLLTAEPQAQQDVPPVDRIEATNDPADSTRVELVWTFCGGPSPHELTIDETGLVWRLSRPVCSDTLGGADQRMTLVFSEPVDASALDVQLVETPG